MKLPKLLRLSNLITLYNAILEGKQVQVTINVKEPPKPEYPPPRVTDWHWQYNAVIYVRANRRGTTHWASIPFEVPVGSYDVVLRRKF